MLNIFSLTATFKDLVLLISITLVFILLFQVHHLQPPTPPLHSITACRLPTPTPTPNPLSLSHLHFSIASSSLSLSSRIPYISLWYSPNLTNAHIFLDAPNPNIQRDSLPPIIISSGTSKFPYTYPRGLPSAIRIARIVKETITLLDKDQTFRWFVFGDDDTVFFPENLVRVLSKYDHHQWYYIGYGSESYEQSQKHSFDMAFGGGGFAISAPLARVLAKVLDPCLIRYPHLYGSDDRIFACVTELGVGLTREPGFHQVDVRGNLFGMLTAHPLSPLVSLHHIGASNPIFPGMGKVDAMQLLFNAVHVDSTRILQRTFCYLRSQSLTFSISWGYAIQVFEGDKLLLDILPIQRTFEPWRRSKNVFASHYMFTTREVDSDLCKRPAVFFLSSAASDPHGVWTEYTKLANENCIRNETVQLLQKIRVFSQRLQNDMDQAPRRQCCHITPPLGKVATVHIRQCGIDELISVRA